jgi:hypothetical protein
MLLKKKLKFVCQLMKKFHSPHVDFVEGGKHGVGVLGLLQSLGNAQPHAVHLHTLLRSGASDFLGGVSRGQFHSGSFNGLECNF